MSATIRPNIFGPAAKIIRDERFLTVYANQIRMGANINDISFTLSILEDAAGQATLVDKVAVILSPVSFKTFVANLNMVLAQYEAVLGTIVQSQGAIDSIAQHALPLRANLEAQIASQKPPE